MICTNWGCTKEYFVDRNDKKVCLHHPGKFEFGSEHGLWGEGWTCCRQPWDAQGCTYGVHRGQRKNRQIKFCLNHGEPNPKSVYPDSYCGKPYVIDSSGKMIDDDAKCVTHAGYFKVLNKRTGDGVWSCCQSDEREGAGCVEGAHKTAEFPDEEAKKLFYDMPLKNPSDNWKRALSP